MQADFPHLDHPVGSGSPSTHPMTGPLDASVWHAIRRELEGPESGGGLNMARAAVSRHAGGTLGRRPALRWLPVEGDRREWSYDDLERLSNRMAHVLSNLGLASGQVVATFCGRVPELYLTALGALKIGAVYCALFASYGPDPILHRLAASHAAVLITTRRLYGKIRDRRRELPGLSHILLIDPPDFGQWPEVKSLSLLMDGAGERFAAPPDDSDAPALLHFTSGTTGMPKGVVHVHAAALHHLHTARRVLDLNPSDLFWCTADPGWVTGVIYGFLAPLMAGVTTLVDEAEFDARRWLQHLADERVTVWYTSPSAIRRLMRLPFRPRERYALEALRLVFSVGEPLSAAAVRWGEEALGTPIRDTWWQTETGGIMIAHHPREPIRPGAMGRPVDGILADVLNPDAPAEALAGSQAGKIGELVLRAGWPSMFRRQLGNAEAYRRRFRGRWYLSGDRVRRDPQGVYWFVGRTDDMIKTAGHLVSPFEVESVLLEHPDVYEAGVVGVPDERVGERVKAYLCLLPGVVADDTLRDRILAFARQRLGPALAPREIDFIDQMPKNQAGKIVRKTLVDRG